MAETASLNLNPRAVIGANMPPLLEQLTEETKLLVQRADDLIGGASRAVVTDRDSAERATLLAGMLRDHIKLIDKAREERKLPFLRDGRIVDAHFGAIESRLATYDPKGKVIGGPLHTVVSKVDRYRRDEEAKAASERARLEEAARVERAKAAAALRAQQEAEERERRAAEEAARKVREADEAVRRATDAATREKIQREAAEARAVQQREEHAARQREMEAQLEQERSASRAAALERQADHTVAGPIDSGLGVKASARKVVIVTIDDLGKAARHCIKVAEPEMREVVQKIFDRLARAKVRNLPGATVTDDSTTTIRGA